jgi:hypothetical protein
VIVHPRALAVLATLAAAGACGGGGGGDILDELAALPGTRVVEVTPPDAVPGVRYFDLWFEQPVDHAAAGGATFEQYGALIHVDPDAPMVVYTSGYGAGRLRRPSEVAALVGGNQLSLEYRYYRTSVPAPTDWSRLDVAQASADIHAVVERVKPLYPGAWLNTGGSKGGETTLHSRYFYPDDYAGSIAYVTPVRTANPDLRYGGILDRIGDPTCRDRLRAAQRAIMLRKAEMSARAQAAGDSYAILGVDYATEVSIIELEWAFWQYRGEAACGSIPDPAAPDAELGDFLDQTAPVDAYADPELADSYHAFTYQAMTQLGYPIIDHPHLADLVTVDYQDLRPFLPSGVDAAALALDPAFVTALLDWAATDADRVIIVDGEWDPWVGGAVTLAADKDARRYVVPHGSHGSNLELLPDPERADALDRLERWAGVAIPRLAPPERARERDEDGARYRRGLRLPSDR